MTLLSSQSSSKSAPSPNAHQGEEGLSTAWSTASWEGRRGEDRIVAVRCRWPSSADHDGPALEPPSGLARTVSGQLLSSARAAVTSAARFGAGPQIPSYHVLACFDGHNGAAAARFCQHAIAHIIEAFLPPWGRLGLFPGSDPGGELAAQLQEAMVLSFLELQRQFALAGCPGGATATVALQVGRLLTVGSVGSSRAVLLEAGAPRRPPLELSETHRIGNNLRERQRLLAAGCQVAPVDAAGSGPASMPCRGTGVPRLWPGGLTLSRAIGDFQIGEAVLPLPRIKQVLLPRCGSRLVLASDGVWSQAGGQLLEALRWAPLKTASAEVVRAVANPGAADASVVVADFLPPGTTFQTACRRQEAAAAASPAAGAGGPTAATAGVRAGGQAVLRMLRLSRSKSSPALPTGAAGEAEQPVVAAATLLADFDSAQLLGLVPATASSRSSSSWSSSTAANGQVEPPAAAAPAWCGEHEVQQMLAALTEAHQLWHLARRRQLASGAAAASHADLRRRSEADLAWMAAAAEEAAEAMMAAAADGSQPDEATALPSPVTPAQLPPPLVQPGGTLSRRAPLVLRSNSLAGGLPSTAGVAAASGQRALRRQSSVPSVLATAVAAAASSRPRQACLRRSGSLSNASAALAASDETIISRAAGTRHVSFAGDGGWGSDSDQAAASPRIHLPPPLKQQSLPPGSGAASSLLSRPFPSSALAGRPPLPRSSSLGSAFHGSSTGSSGMVMAPLTPPASIDVPQPRAPRRAAASEQGTSPDTHDWLTGYSLSASMYTRAGSSYHARRQ